MQKGAPLIPLRATLNGFRMQVKVAIGAFARFQKPPLGKLAVGQKIQIKWDAKPGRIWNGHIERTPVTVVNLGTRSVGEVLVTIDDLDSELLPQTNVNVTATISSESNALTVPREALRSE